MLAITSAALRRPLLPAVLASAVVVLVGGCGEEAEPDNPAGSAPATTAATQPSDSRVPRNGGPGGKPLPVGDGRGGVLLEPVASLSQPLWITQPPGERSDLYVVEQCGRIMRLPGGDGEPETFLDISDQVTCGGEQGLLSLAFAPDYERSGLFYIYFTDLDENQKVVELARSADDPAVADPESAREVIAFEDSYSNHNGGLLVFGPDRQLWIGTGDGGSAGDPDRNALDLSSPLGKLLRIDPRLSRGEPYSVPSDNPFADREGALEEVVLYGLRNPWRYSFDRQTGDLWIGDVGQSSQEEVDGVTAGTAGESFGWSAFEGTERFNDDQSDPDAVPPVLTYSHETGGCSVTGGYVVRDPELPSLYGRYVYGDFCVGELRSFTAVPGREATDDRGLGLEVPALSSFGEDNSGQIYATSAEGEVFRLVAE